MKTTVVGVATLLGIQTIKKGNDLWWVCTRGPLIRELGLSKDGFKEHEAPINAMTLAEACAKALELYNGTEPCEFFIMKANSLRAMIYMEIEEDTLQQELLSGEKIVDAIGGTDPRDVITNIMEQCRVMAQALGRPGNLYTEFLRTSVIAVNSYLWAKRWFATLQTQPQAGPIRPGLTLLPRPERDGGVDSGFDTRP